jgi:hypothetical protein
MKTKELKTLVDNAVVLHRQIAAKSEQLKQIKASLVQQARLHPKSLVPTESGGKRWTVQGSDGCIARVSFPAAALLAEIEAESGATKQIQAIVGDDFRKLFTPVKIYRPVEQFRARAEALLSSEEAQTLLTLCENESAPRVSFETAKPAKDAAAA